MDRAVRILAGDVGGTKTDLGLFTIEGSRIRLVHERRFVNRDHPSFYDMAGEFMRRSGETSVEGAFIGVAATVEDNSSRMTNMDWLISGEEIGKRFDIRRVSLINDLVATAWGISILKVEDFFILQDRRPRPGNGCLIAAGTGLGEAPLFWDGSSLVPSPSEGGHCDFAPRDDLEIELLEFLIRRFGHVSYERVLSGPGLKNIYDFLLERRGEETPRHVRERFDSEGPSPVISELAIKGEDRACVEALRIFISIYGAEAGNLALKTLAVGGVYIGGGIAPKILGLISEGPFMDSFAGKGRFEGFLRTLPVRMILNEKTALLGAARYGAGSLLGKAGGFSFESA